MRLTRQGLVVAAVVTAAVPLTLGGPLAAGADESGKAPKAILADLARDLGKVKGYHFSGSETDSGGTSTVAGDVTASGGADVTTRQSGSTVRIVLLPSAAYLKGDAAYWKASGGKDGAALAKRLAGRWVKVPASVSKDFSGLFDDLAPKHLATCAAVGTGTLKVGGTTTVGGRKAIVIVDAGDKPATSPGKLYVSATGAVLPLRVTQTGKRRSGGHLDTRCQQKDDDSTASDVIFSGFDHPRAITAPKGAIALPTGGGDPTGTPA